MSQYQLTKSIKENQELFASFNQLAEETFEISFKKWKTLNYWQASYIPYALVNQGEVIANASITKGELVVNEKRLQVIQIGTVMTKKAYRSQGLSKQLLEKIIADYYDQVDMIYLFANETVLDFYPKFGFKRVDEVSVVIPTKQLIEKESGIVKCQFESVKEKLEKQARSRNNDYLDTYMVDNYSLTMFYFSTVFSEMIYYLAALDCFVTYEIDGNELHLFDILSTKKISMKEVLCYLPVKEVGNIICHFHVKEESDLMMTIQREPLDDDALFVLGKRAEELEEIKCPLFSHA